MNTDRGIVRRVQRARRIARRRDHGSWPRPAHWSIVSPLRLTVMDSGPGV